MANEYQLRDNARKRLVKALAEYMDKCDKCGFGELDEVHSLNDALESAGITELKVVPND